MSSSSTVKRNFINSNTRTTYNMKDNWNDYGGLSPNRQNKGGKYNKGRGGQMKGAAYSDVEAAGSAILAHLNGKCGSESIVPGMKSNDGECTMPRDDSTLLINQDPAIAAIAPASEKDEKLDNTAEVSVVPESGQCCQHQHYQTAENSQMTYVYDGYSTPNHQVMQQQQQSYVWQQSAPQATQQAAFSDYASVAAANAAAVLINTSAQSQNGMNTPANMASPATAYYTPAPSYQSYVYDPAIAAVSYPGGMVATTAYSPMSNAQAILSSPQQHNSTALFHTYQTPPPMTKYPHQLYMTPPASGSPSDLLNSAERLDTPQQQQQPTGIYTTSPYVYTSSYLASPPQPNYQYQTQIMYSPPQAPAQPTQMVHHQASLMQTPTSTFQNLTINTSLNTPTPSESGKYGLSKFNQQANIKANHYNYKKQNKNKQQFSCYSPASDVFSPNSQPSPAVNQQLCFDESADEQTDLTNSPSMYPSMLFPPTSYMSPMPSSNSLAFQQTPSQAPSYDYPTLTPPMGQAMYPTAPGFDYNQYDSYGDEFVDDNEPQDSSNGDENDDEQLACQICRGRRMCFCYFLKVRYYKFPSFFDLVDHQYKKWRSSMAANGSPKPVAPPARKA